MRKIIFITVIAGLLSMMTATDAAGYSKDPLMQYNIISCELAAQNGIPAGPIEIMKENAKDYKDECAEIKKNGVMREKNFYDGKISSEFEYSRSGKILKKIYFENNEPVTEYRYDYDSAENLIGSVSVSKSSQLTRKTTICLEYDEKGNIVEWRENFSGEFINAHSSLLNFVYDREGRLLAVSKFKARPDENFRLDEKESFKYDEWGECVEYSHIHDTTIKGYTIERETYEVEYYDAQPDGAKNVIDESRNVKSRTFNIKGEKKFKNSYNEKGELVEIIYFDKKGGQTKKIVYEYDSNGNNIIENRFNKIDKLVSSTVRRYSGNDLTAVMTCDRKGKPVLRSEKSYATEPDGSKKVTTNSYDVNNKLSGRLESFYYNNGLDKGYNDEMPIGEKHTMTCEYEYYK